MNETQLIKMSRLELPRYSYDHHIVTAPFVGALSRLGVDFRVPVKESQPISALEAQREAGKAIYGKGYIVSEQVFAEREKAERWELSDKERAIVDKLTAQGGRPIPAA